MIGTRTVNKFMSGGLLAAAHPLKSIKRSNLMKFNNRFIYGVISIVLAVVIAFIAIPTVISKTNGKTEIARITKSVEKGALITKDDIETVEVGSYNLPSNIAKKPDDVVGKYAAADLVPGDYILSTKISDTPISSDIQLSQIPSGKVAISLTIKSLASGLSDKLQQGDIIRIYHFVDFAVDVPELQFVKVLSVSDSKGFDVDNTKVPEDDEDKRQSATITVLASPEQAKIIPGLENEGVIHVALISRGNAKLAAELLGKQDEVLKKIYGDKTAVSTPAGTEVPVQKH